MFALLMKVMTISASGAFAPGPLTTAIAAAGLKKGWKAGIYASLGHTVVEFPLVLILSAGVAAIFKNRAAMISVGFVGAAFLLVFGFSTIRDAIRTTNYKSIVGPIDFRTGPLPNCAQTPLVIGQWFKGKKFPYEMSIVDNSTAPEIPTNAAPQLITY